MAKEIQIVFGMIYDDEYYIREGVNRFYHLNGDIETNSAGEQVYICTKLNENTGKNEDVECRVCDTPKYIQKYIEKYTQRVTDRGQAKYIAVHSSQLV